MEKRWESNICGAQKKTTLHPTHEIVNAGGTHCGLLKVHGGSPGVRRVQNTTQTRRTTNKARFVTSAFTIRRKKKNNNIRHRAALYLEARGDSGGINQGLMRTRTGLAICEKPGTRDLRGLHMIG